MVAALFTFATLGWEQRQIRKQHRAMANARTALTPEKFLGEMEDRGVSQRTAEFLSSWLSYAYRDSLKPAPDDHIYSDLHVLGDDASALVVEYFSEFGEHVPDHLDGSELDDPTLAELGLWLETFRNK